MKETISFCNNQFHSFMLRITCLLSNHGTFPVSNTLPSGIKGPPPYNFLRFYGRLAPFIRTSPPHPPYRLGNIGKISKI